MKRRIVALALTAPLLLGACGTAVSKEPAPAAPAASAAAPNVKTVAEISAGSNYNDTDVMFLQMLVDNQQQGQQMVRTAISRAQRQDVVDMATAVELTQTDELTMMKNWLKEWGKPATLDKRESLHADHGGLPNTRNEKHASLKTVKKANFETAFLNLFLAHQHNAVELASLELSQGGNEQAKAFAERVKQSRTDQVQQMLKLLNS